jgi:hypothetical protein
MIIAGIMIAVAEMAGAFGASPFRTDAIAYTVLMFFIITGMLRPAWRRGAFWGWLGAAFVAHVFVVIGLEHGFPAFARRFSGIPLGLAFMAEAIGITGVLSRKLREPKADLPGRLSDKW